MTMLELKEKLVKFIEENPDSINLHLVNEDDYSVHSYFGDFEVRYQAKTKDNFWHLYSESYIQENANFLSNIEKVILMS